MFRHLRSKLTALYVALFMVSLSLIAAAIFAATTHNVEQIGRSQLASSGTVFDNLLATRNRGLRDEAGVLAHDYGFRAAVATGDAATVRSALDNLAARLGIDLAFVIGPDGQVTARQLGAGLPPEVVRAVQDGGSTSGMFHLNGVAYETVAAPILTPTPAGWVVFATALRHEDMAQLERLSAIPLRAEVLGRGPDGAWASLSEGGRRPSAPALQALINRSLTTANTDPVRLTGSNGATLALVRPMASLDDGRRVVLLLRYPLADALKPFHALFANIVVIGLTGVLLLIFGSWLIARTVTRPISQLEAAAKRLQDGEPARVTVRTKDEIARLGSTFNAMADHIEEREASLKHARDRAEAADLAKTQFLANMNHEFRTPLNGVLGVASVLAKTPLDDNQRKMLSMVEGSGQTLQRILNDVLDMVEIGAGSFRANSAPFHLGDTLRWLGDGAAAAARAKGLAFRLDVAPDDCGWVCGDVKRVSQIVSNLLDNAVKFTDQGQVTVTARCEPAGDLYRIEVRDTGVGFDPKCIDQIFQPFSQADGSMTRRFGGTGLGLSLARETARAMGGDILADGKIGYGASFCLTLHFDPAERPEAMPAGVPLEDELSDTETDAPPIKILLAEDHPANRVVVQLILDAIGVELVSVENGAQAVAAFKQQSFDVILMDLQMPVMDGLTAIRLIRELEGTGVRTPILVLSANVQEAHLKASAAAGADRHLSKPIVADALITELEAALDSAGPQDDQVFAKAG